MAKISASLPFAVLILAGGRSSRMGTDKALLEWRGANLLTTLARRLRPLARCLAVVSRNPQAHSLPFAITIQDESPVEGPLSGLVSGMRNLREDWYFVIGCDMPFVEVEAVLELGSLREGYDAAALGSNGGVQPLHAFYSRNCLSAAESRLSEGDSSLRGLLSQVRVRLHHPLSPKERSLFSRSCRDLDTPEELVAARAERA